MSIAAMNFAWQINGLKSACKLVLMAVADSADDAGFCWPSIPTVARKTCMSERNVQRILRTLESRGLLRVEQRFRNDGSATSNGYHIILSGDKFSPPQRHNKHQMVTRASPPGDKVVTQTTTESSVNQKKPPQQLTSGESNAEEFCRREKDYFYPKQLTPLEQLAASQLLSGIDATIAQQILNVLGNKLGKEGVNVSVLGYLKGIIKNYQNGTFSTNSNKAQNNSRKHSRAQNPQKTPLNPTPKDKIPERIATMHRALGRGQSLIKRTNRDGQSK